MAFFMYVTSKIQLYSHYDHREISDISSIPIYLGDKFQPCLLEQARRRRQQSNITHFSPVNIIPEIRNNSINEKIREPSLNHVIYVADRSTALYSLFSVVLRFRPWIKNSVLHSSFFMFQTNLYLT